MYFIQNVICVSDHVVIFDILYMFDHLLDVTRI